MSVAASGLEFEQVRCKYGEYKYGRCVGVVVSSLVRSPSHDRHATVTAVVTLGFMTAAMAVAATTRVLCRASTAWLPPWWSNACLFIIGCSARGSPRSTFSL